MKKLFFMLVLIAGFGLSMQAQATFLPDDVAIESLKEFRSELLSTVTPQAPLTVGSAATTPVDVVNATNVNLAYVARVYMEEIQAEGNTAQVFEAFINSNQFDRISSDMQTIRESLLERISK